MTFTEAALEVLRREGKPLHFSKITELAIREDLLDHVGKVPEDTMADQLVAHARLPHAERRLVAVQRGTFALVEWDLEEDPSGIDNLVEPPPEDMPLRGRERHPVPLRDLARAAVRAEPKPDGARPRKREEEGGRGHRFPPPAEVAYEILASAGRALGLVDVAAQGAERLLMTDAFVRDTESLRAALLEDNRRRESAGRKALFAMEGDQVSLVAQPEPGERAALPAPARAITTPADLRRAALAALRRRMRESDGATVEHIAAKLLLKMGFGELKVAKRGREHVIYTGRRRMGLAEIRHAVRIVRGGADTGRREVSELRRDLGHYGAQIGFVLSAGEANREARSEAGAAGQLPVLLVCGEALAEIMAESGVGCVPVIVPEVDDAFFRDAAQAAEKEEAARLARREDRERRRDRDVAREPSGAGSAEISVVVVSDIVADTTSPRTSERSRPAEESAVPVEIPITTDDLRDEADGGEDEGDEVGEESDGPEEAVPAAGTPGATLESKDAERRRRRRRRRRRGGRGRGREGGVVAGAPAEGAPVEGSPASVTAAEAPMASEPVREVPPPLPKLLPPGGGEGGGDGGGSSGGA